MRTLPGPRPAAEVAPGTGRKASSHPSDRSPTKVHLNIRLDAVCRGAPEEKTGKAGRRRSQRYPAPRRSGVLNRAGLPSADESIAPSDRPVPREGFEPTPPCGERILSPPRLPFRHLGRIKEVDNKKAEGAVNPVLLCIGRICLEATGGFEPPNRAFAELRLNHLATSPSCYCTTFVVPRRRFELLRANAHGPLKTACLPIPPPRHGVLCPRVSGSFGRSGRIRTPDLRFWRPLL